MGDFVIKLPRWSQVFSSVVTTIDWWVACAGLLSFLYCFHLCKLDHLTILQGSSMRWGTEWILQPYNRWNGVDRLLWMRRHVSCKRFFSWWKKCSLRTKVTWGFLSACFVKPIILSKTSYLIFWTCKTLLDVFSVISLSSSSSAARNAMYVVSYTVSERQYGKEVSIARMGVCKTRNTELRNNGIAE